MLAFRFGFWFTATVVLTGAQAATATGTPVASGAANVAITGVACSSAIGTLTVTGAASAIPTGIVGTSAAGTPILSGTANTTLTGASASSAAGTISQAGDGTATGTGQQVTSATGTLVVTGNANAILIGVEPVSAAGAVVATSASLASPTGQQVQASTGSFVVSGTANIAIIGQGVAIAPGTVTGVGDQVQPAPVTPEIPVLNESDPSSGGFLVGKDLATIRGKFIYHNAPPVYNAVAFIDGRGIKAKAGRVVAIGGIGTELKGVAAIAQPGRVVASGMAKVIPFPVPIQIIPSQVEAEGIIDISDEDLLAIIGELVA